MIPKGCKRLAEVDFPIAVVSRHAAREKSIRHGHPSTLHLWWARRPLAACRAMLMALLLPDPADPHCPEDFKKKAREILAPVPVALEPDDDGLRRALLKFIGDFSNWDLSNNRLYVEAASSLVKAAHDEEAPLVVDPFAGGGSIPLEALRLGCDAFASDLNPVACLILKVMLEDIPRWGRQKVKVKSQNGEEVEADGLAEALRIVGKEIKEKAEKELAEFYPKDPDGATPIAYLWARTVKCESPNCGAEIPLMRSFWLCKKPNRKYALRYKVLRAKAETPYLDFEIFEPKTDSEVSNGTVTRAKATCPSCGKVLPPERVRAQLSAQQGGADVIFDEKGKRVGGAWLLAVVTLKPGEQGRQYRVPNSFDYKAIFKAQRKVQEIIVNSPRGLKPVPDEPLPWKHGHRAIGSPRVYGMRHWGDLFTDRQKLGMIIMAKETQSLPDGPVKDIIALQIGKAGDGNNSLSRWMASSENPVNLFSRQALPMVWDFCESTPISQARGVFLSGINYAAEVIESAINLMPGQVQQADACNSSLPDQSCDVWFTDPPYYDAIPYADISDFFFVWLKRALNEHRFLDDPLDKENSLTPKRKELTVTTVASEKAKPKNHVFFEKGMAAAFLEGRRVLKKNGLGCIVFAHKTTEGWEALLGGIIKGGWTIMSSWPVATESSSRLNARDTASLATSIHLVCQPRSDNASTGDWIDVIKELPVLVCNWMERLQKEGVRGADLVFACIGPALEIYSRYSKVVDAEDREIPLGGDPMAVEPHKRGYLAYVWEAVGRAALEQVLGNAEAKARDSTEGALEEDARLTALFLWTLQGTNGNGAKVNDKDVEEEIDEDEEDLTPQRKKGGFNLIFDVVRRFAQPLGIRLPDWESRIIETNKGVVRLLPVKERAKQLFGDTGAQAVADQLEKSPPRDMQLKLFPVEAEGFVPMIKGRGGKRSKRVGVDVSDEDLRSRKEATTLDRVHAAMLLQAGGRANALRALLKVEVERGPDFLRLANALSALYPKVSEEKRLLDAMLLAVPK